MSLARDHSDMADAANTRAVRPDADPEISPLLIRKWAEEDQAQRSRPFADERARVRHSWSGKCSRALQYLIRKEPESNPPTEPDYYRFAVGRNVHELWQDLAIAALTDAGWTNVSPEYVVTTGSHEEPLSAGNGDLFAVSPTGRRTMFELKTINGFGFKSIIGTGNGPAGPRSSDLMQGAMNAFAADADDLKMVYLALELVSPSIARKAGLSDIGRFCAEWTVGKDTWLPIAVKERGRWEEVVAATDNDILLAPSIPDPDLPPGAIITDPATGRWDVTDSNGYITSSGRTWHCDYCSFRHKCQSDS